MSHAALAERAKKVHSFAMAFEFLSDLPASTPPQIWEWRPGFRLAWAEFGEREGIPTFYYHGWPSSRQQGRMLHHLAAEQGLRLIAMDRPGMGQSTRVDGRKLTDWPELMAGFADHLGVDRFLQLGVSGGGPYGLACAALIPERVAGSAVLCGAVSLAEGGLKFLHRGYRMLAGMRHVSPWLLSPFFRVADKTARMNPRKPPLAWLLKTIAAADREVLLENDGLLEVLAASFQEGIRQGGRGVMSDADIYLQPWGFPLEEVRSPIDYWHGSDDQHIPARLAEALVARIPTATLRVIPGEGHFSLALRYAGEAMAGLRARIG